MSEFSFAPEVVALLDDIALRSDSSLLRLPKERLLRWVGQPEEMLSPHGVHLSKAERHLISAYREEAAYLLHASCVERLIARPQSGVFLESSRRHDMGQVQARVSQLGARAPTLGIEWWLFESPVEASPLQLASAALALVPSDLARIALGVACYTEGHVRAAMRMFETVLAGRPSSIMRSVAYDNQGGVQCAQRDYERALVSYSEACRAEDGRWKSVVSRMIVALQLGAGSEALQAARELGHLKVSPESFDELLAFLRFNLAAKSWTLTRQARETIMGLGDNLSEEARRVCNAIHPTAS